MFVNEIEFMKRKNLGNYEHEEIKLSISLTEEDDATEAMTMAKNFVISSLEGKSLVTAQVEKKTNAKETKEEAPAPKKKRAPRKTKAQKEASEAKADAAVSYTPQDVQEALRKVAIHHKSKEKALALLEEVAGVKAAKDLSSADYGKVIEAAEKAIA